jgi:NADH:ubiquinone oxidoreductase subunit 6 (subunit J)
MEYALLIGLVAVLEIASALLIFAFRNVLNSVLALSATFLFNSILFLALQQTLLALIQLFIMVGGVSTYIFVGVATSGLSKFRHTSHYALGVLATVLTVAYATDLIYTAQGTVLQTNQISGPIIRATLGANIGVLYIIAFVLFATGLSAIILLRSIGKRR